MQSATAASSSLTPAQLSDYERNGFLIVREVFSKFEMSLLAIEADQLLELTHLMDTNNTRCRWSNHVESNECQFDAFDPVIDLSPMCGQLARDLRLINIASAIYGEKARLFKDKLIFKRPGARGYDLHQDFISWPSFPKSFLTIAVAIDPSGANNGCTEVFAGAHRGGYLSPLDGNYHPLPLEKVNGFSRVNLELEPGDIAIFGGFTPHCSAANQSDQWRRLLYLSYNADSEGGDCRDAHYEEFQGWLKKKYAEFGKHNTYFR